MKSGSSESTLTSAFTGPLTLTQLDDWKLWRLEQPLRYEIGRYFLGRARSASAIACNGLGSNLDKPSDTSF